MGLGSLTPPGASQKPSENALKAKWLQSDISNLVKQSPNDADDAGRARTPGTRASAAQLGTHFGMIGTRKGQKPKGNPSKLTFTHQKQPKKTTTSAKPRLGEV